MHAVHEPHSSPDVVGTGVDVAAMVLGWGVNEEIAVGVGTGVEAGAEVVLGEFVGAGVVGAKVVGAGVVGAKVDVDVDGSSAGADVTGAAVDAGVMPSHTALTTKLLALHLVPVGTGFNIGIPWAHWYHQSPHSDSQMMPLAGTLSQTDGRPEPLLVMSLQFPSSSPSSLTQRPAYSSAGATPNSAPVESSGHAA
jgi:hypothetical protein